MYRRSSIAISLVLMLAVFAVSAVAQSGRGRQLRIQQMLPAHDEVATPVTAEVQPVTNWPGTGPAATNVPRKNSALIYNDASSSQKRDSGEYHMTKGDKRAGWILLGVLVFEGIVFVANDGNF